jgi:2-polyprenyl-6-methoxyphenol hydroxylase-like FAD-dependent oxidoreductase
LQQQLLDRAKECGVRLETGVKVVDVAVDQSTISLDDGRTVTADLIAAADGVHVSPLRFGTAESMLTNARNVAS